MSFCNTRSIFNCLEYARISINHNITEYVCSSVIHDVIMYQLFALVQILKTLKEGSWEIVITKRFYCASSFIWSTNFLTCILLFCRYNGVEGLHTKVTEFVKDKDCLVCGPGIFIELDTSVTLKMVILLFLHPFPVVFGTLETKYWPFQFSSHA